MNADMCPTEPLTTISMPRAEMPQRLEALPSITSKPPQPVAPAEAEASPLTCTRPDIMFSATADAGRAVDDDISTLVHAGTVIADIAVNLDP